MRCRSGGRAVECGGLEIPDHACTKMHSAAFAGDSCIGMQRDAALCGGVAVKLLSGDVSHLAVSCGPVASHERVELQAVPVRVTGVARREPALMLVARRTDPHAIDVAEPLKQHAPVGVGLG